MIADTIPPINQVLKSLDEMSAQLGMAGINYADAARAIRCLQERNARLTDDIERDGKTREALKDLASRANAYVAKLIY